jgi:hypothetical protein
MDSPFDPKNTLSIAGRRPMGYRNDYEDIELLLVVDEKRMTSEEQNNLATFVMRAIVAYQGFVKNEEKIGELCGLVTFGIPDRLIKIMGKGFIQKVREAFAYAFALVMGYDLYNHGIDFDPDCDVPDDIPKGYYIPPTRTRH